MAAPNKRSIQNAGSLQAQDGPESRHPHCLFAWYISTLECTSAEINQTRGLVQQEEEVVLPQVLLLQTLPRSQILATHQLSEPLSRRTSTNGN